MNTDQTRRPSVPDEPPVGSGPDKITLETPVCPTKNIKCSYWTDGRCLIAVCWVKAGGPEQGGVSP